MIQVGGYAAGFKRSTLSTKGLHRGLELLFCVSGLGGMIGYVSFQMFEVFV